MSVKLIYEAPQQCPLIQEIGGYCYCRPNVNSKPRTKGILTENKIIVDFGDHLDALRTLSPVNITVDFGLVPVESTAFREIHIIDSSSQKPLKITTIRHWKPKTIDRAFRLLQSTNTSLWNCQLKLDSFEKGDDGDGRQVGWNRRSNEAIKLRLTFDPELPTMHYVDAFLICAGDHSIRLECRGLSEGPSVCFSENVLNFGGQYYKDESRLRFKMMNSSGCEAQFQFDNDNIRSTFKICPTSGIIPAFMALTVEVHFQAQKPQTFYKRVICLLHHQQPQYIDLIGVCIPRPFFSISAIDFCLSTTESRFLPFPTESNEEYFESNHIWGINFSRDVVNFGFQNVFAKSGTQNEPSIVAVASVLPYDVVIEWFQDPLEIFLINPHTCVLPAFQSVEFQVYFQPNSPDTFFSGQLECFVYSIGHIWPPPYGPPWEYMFGQHILNTDQTVHEPTVMFTPTVILRDEGENSKSSPPEKNEGKNSFDTRTVRPSTAGPLKKGNTYGGAVMSVYQGKGKGGRKKGRVKTARSTPVILPSSKLENEDILLEVKTTSLPTLERPSGSPDERFLEELAEPATIKVSQSQMPRDVRLFPLQVTMHHSIGGIKRSLHLEPVHASGIGMTADSAKELSIKAEGEGEDEEGNGYNYNNNSAVQLNNFQPRRWSSKSNTGAAAAIKKAAKSSIHKTQSQQKFSFSSGAGEPLGTMTEKSNSLAPAAEEETNADSPASTMPAELGIPLCLTLRVTGHTFENHSLIPHFKVPKKLTMNPTWPQNKICRSFMVKNMNDLPLYFDAGIVEGDGVYRVKPQLGVIPGNFHQILMISMMPKMADSCLYVHNCQVEFNLSDKNLICLRGIAELPSLDVVICYSSDVNESEIVCPQTIPGCGSDTNMEFMNTSRFYYRYELFPLDELEEEDLSVFTPTPSEGIIAPYETVKIKWKFIPYADEAYYVKWKAHFQVLRAMKEHANGATYYELPITLAGVGRYCVFEAKPDNLEFEMVEIFKEKEMSFTITNRSNVVVTADLRIMHEEWLQWYQPRHIRIDPTTVTLAGSESTKVRVVVRPDRTNFQKFYIEYAVELTEDEGEGQQVLNNFKKLCDISFIGDHAIFKVTDAMLIGRHPIWDSGQIWSMFSLDSLNEYLKPSRNTATEGLVPIIPSVAFRFPPAPVGSDPAIVTILLSNNEQLGGFWDLHTLPPKKWSRKFLFHKKDELNKGVYDGSVSDNKEMLNLIWSRKLVGDGVKANSGKRESNDSAASGMAALYRRKSHSRHHSHGHVYGHVTQPAPTDALKDVDLFKVSPTRGILKPRESQQISFRYSYKSVGRHGMNVLVRIHPAIFIWLELIGTTLGQNEPFIQLMHKDFMQFHPVCLSDLDPPIQMFWLFNGGNVPSSFVIDPEPFQQVKSENYDHEIFECLSMHGIVPPRSWAPVLIRFSPLELLEYCIKLNIQSENRLRVVTIKGEAVLKPAITLLPESHGSIKRELKLIDPLVPVTISPTHITFTHFVPTGQKSTSIIFLTNLSGKNKISFSWPDVPIEGDGSITFLPDVGVIRPKEQATIMVVVKAGKVATIFSRMIRCLMVDESTLARYELMSKVWNTHKDVLIRSMTKEEAEARLTKKFNGKPERPSSFSRVVSVKVFIGTVFGLLDTVVPREHAKMPFSDFLCQPLKNNSLTLLPFARQLCRGILSDMIWDMVNSPSFTSYVKRMSKLRAPFYYEYKSSEIQDKMARKGKMKRIKEPLIPFPRQASQDVLEQVIFNMIQEIAEDFYPRKTQHGIRPIQPQELVDIKEYRGDFL